MEPGENSKQVRDLLQSFLKAKKILRMYPRNNPIYVNTLEDNFGKFRNFFFAGDELNLKIRQNEIFFDDEQVYFSPDKEDNLALFFFKDGFRELTFSKGLTHEEVEEFLKIISLDFNREALDDDVVTLFWEKDFQNIKYVVDETIVSDDEEYESKAVAELKEKETGEDNLLRAYEDAFREGEAVTDVAIVPLSDKDLQLLLQELEKDTLDKSEKLIDILFEMFDLSDTREDIEDLIGFFINTAEFALGRGDIHLVTSLLARIRRLIEDESAGETIRSLGKKVILFAGSERAINLLGEFLDSGQEVDERIFENFVKFLDKNAIVPFMKILGELQTIHSRKVVIDALTFLGSKDIVTLARGLNDSRWYVVRNIIYILRKIGDKRAVDHLLKTVKHGDIRVRKEVVRTLGELGGAGVLQALRECLDDPEPEMRFSALKALSSMGSEAAKRIVLNKISDKNFREKDFEEKKEYFETLSRWKDSEVFNYLVTTIKNKTFFGRARNDEIRACAAYCLGLVGNRDALPLLNKYKNDNSKVLKEFAYTAIKRLEHGQ